jgi:hypothetical protein
MLLSLYSVIAYEPLYGPGSVSGLLVRVPPAIAIASGLSRFLSSAFLSLFSADCTCVALCFLASASALAIRADHKPREATTAAPRKVTINIPIWNSPLVLILDSPPYYTCDKKEEKRRPDTSNAKFQRHSLGAELNNLVKNGKYKYQHCGFGEKFKRDTYESWMRKSDPKNLFRKRPNSQHKCLTTGD